MPTTTRAALAIGRQVLALRRQRMSLAPTMPAPPGTELPTLVPLRPVPLPWLGDDTTPTLRPEPGQ